MQNKPDWFQAPQVIDMDSVSNCVSEDFADCIPFCKHSGDWFFDSPEIMNRVAKENLIRLEGTSLFYCEAYEMESDGESWHSYSPEASFPTSVVAPAKKQPLGFEVDHFTARTSPECSSLSCSSLATIVQMPIVCLTGSTRQRRMSATERSMNPSRVHTEYFLFIR